MGMFLIVFLFMLTVVILMAVGILLGRKPIAGSCGGMSAIGMDTACDVCGGDQSKCDTEIKKAEKTSISDLSYDASKKINHNYKRS